jgi:hypothetical protein
MRPIGEHPFQLAMPIFPPPGFIEGRRRDAGFANIDIRLPVWGNSESYERFDKISRDDPRKRRVHVKTEVDFDPFCKPLAKIAHSFAVASQGYGAFEPFLCKYILAPKRYEHRWHVLLPVMRRSSGAKSTAECRPPRRFSSVESAR